MSAPRICKGGCARDLDALGMRKDAQVCELEKCRSAWRRSCEKLNPKTGLIAGHRIASLDGVVGPCTRCGAKCLLPREWWRRKRSRPEYLKELRTRALDDPPKHRPKPEHLLRADGTQLYDGCRRLLTLNQREWLNVVTPDPDYIKRPQFERHSDWRPAFRSGIVGGGAEDHSGADPVDVPEAGSGRVNHSSGPPNRHIYASVLDDPAFKRRWPVAARMIERGEELPGQREWREWQARPPKPEPRLYPAKGERRRYIHILGRREDEDEPSFPPIERAPRCDCGEIIVPRGAEACRRCEGPPRWPEKDQKDRDMKVATLKTLAAEARADLVDLEKAA